MQCRYRVERQVTGFLVPLVEKSLENLWCIILVDPNVVIYPTVLEAVSQLPGRNR